MKGREIYARNRVRNGHKTLVCAHISAHFYANSLKPNGWLRLMAPVFVRRLIYTRERRD